MIYVGIDVAKEKHDCCILGSNGEIIKDSFTFTNSKKGFQELMAAILMAAPKKKLEEVRVGLESTGHYSTNFVAFIRGNGIQPVIFNPLSVSLLTNPGNSMLDRKSTRLNSSHH